MAFLTEFRKLALPKRHPSESLKLSCPALPFILLSNCSLMFASDFVPTILLCESTQFSRVLFRQSKTVTGGYVSLYLIIFGLSK